MTGGSPAGLQGAVLPGAGPPEGDLLCGAPCVPFSEGGGVWRKRARLGAIFGH